MLRLSCASKEAKEWFLSAKRQVIEIMNSPDNQVAAEDASAAVDCLADRSFQVPQDSGYACGRHGSVKLPGDHSV